MPDYTEVMEPVVVNGAAAEAGDTYVMPATQGQVRFWSLDQLNPGNPALNMPLMWKFTGELDLAALARAFEACLVRHETLRTTFDVVDGRLSQVIHPPMAVTIPVVDLSAMAEDLQWVEADRLAREHAAFRMNLKTGPLLELKMVRFNATLHLLLVTMHHIICDGISNGILLRDMVGFYEGLVMRRPASLPELPIQFADFAVWQKEWLESAEPAQSLKFWRESLGNDFRQIELPRDSDAMTVMPERLEAWTGNIETLLIPKELQARALAFCVKENVTLNILLFSIFAAMLHRVTGQYDLTIGSPCANRTEDTAELIGLFMNIQVMRLRLTEETTFQQLLAMVQAWTLGAYENQELPFENLVHDPYFGTGTDSFEIPVFFLYQKSFMLTHHVGALEVVPLRSESPGAVFEMMFAIVDRAEEGPRLQLEYNPRFFKVATIERYLRMFVTLLDAALSGPGMQVDQLAVLAPAELQRVTQAWNQTEADLGPHDAVVTRFLARAEQEPDAVALECDGVTWSCRKLADFATGLAKRLVYAGLEREGLVGIAVARSPEMAGAVLAVMMAGGAYLPLDPGHPKERLAMVLADAEAAFLLVNSVLEVETGAIMLQVADEDGVDAVLPDAPGPGALAYVIYTSGSTGVPKGVAIEHGSLSNLLRSMEREPGLTRDDVLVAITTLAFDIAGLELLLPLVTGAKLIIATDAEVHDGRLLLERMEAAKATVLQATPGAWRVLLDAGWNDQHKIKALCGGETLPRELAERMLARASEVWNMYGPTETTVWSSATRVVTGKGTLLVGPPIANTQFYVLDGRRQAVATGVAGELYIGGAGVARGYWNRPELTAKKFVANPFAVGRMYATGDLARWSENGAIELLGRADFQVKIRGYRIELGEIEAALLREPRAKDAVVIAHKSEATGVTRLVAYVAAETGTAAESDSLIGELKAQLEKTLPEFMLPNAFVILPALPKNANGKTDRKALPAASTSGEHGIHSSLALPEHYYPPTNALERQLVDIWQTTLGVGRVSVRASFFSLGVGSLAALRLITKMNRVYGTDLGLASLISASSIQAIAELIEGRFAPNTTSSLVPLQPNGTKAPLFIVHGVGGNIVNFYGLAMRMGTDQPVYGIQSQALLKDQPALLRLTDMAAVYVRDMRTVQAHGPYHLLGYSFGGTVALEMAHQLRAAGEEVALLGMVDSKSKDYEEQLARLKGMQERVEHRMTRFKGNTEALSWAERAKYIADKFKTRAIRFACMAAARMEIRIVPAFMRSAYDINYVAVQNYKPKPYDGKLVLFRASYQDDARGPYDLGWSSTFSEPIEIHDLPGDHERIFLEPNIDELAGELKKTLVTA